MDNSSLFDDEAYLNPQVLEALPAALIVADLEQRIQSINSAACQTLGITRDAAFGVRLKDLPGGADVMTPEQAEKHRQSLVNALNTYAVGDFKIPVPAPYEQTWSNQVAGGMILKYHSAAIWDAAHQKVIGIVVEVKDVTTEHTGSEVLSSLFNEMVTPLSVIQGLAEILLLKSVDMLNDEQHEMLKLIAEKAGFLWQLRENAYDTMIQHRNR
jgi:PAS domain S-box-containing protein